MAKQGRLRKFLNKRVSRLNVGLYRLSGGRVGSKIPGGAPILLLTTTGRKSGKPRTQPLLYLEDGERLVVVASKAGHDHHPHWYLNLRDDPNVEVEIKKERRPMHATDATDEERERYWPQLDELYKGYQKYRDRTDRAIPLVVLRPR